MVDSFYISNIASISTAAPSGKELVLTAALVCFPFSPKILDSKSDAGFITLGWSIKSSDELTKPVILTQFLTLLRSPPTAFLTWAIMFIAQSLEAGEDTTAVYNTQMNILKSRLDSSVIASQRKQDKYYQKIMKLIIYVRFLQLTVQHWISRNYQN